MVSTVKSQNDLVHSSKQQHKEILICSFYLNFLLVNSLFLLLIFLTDNPQGEPDYEMLDKFHEYQEKAEIYHLYHSIQRYTVYLFFPTAFTIIQLLFVWFSPSLIELSIYQARFHKDEM